jgi:predicted Zn-dependent peptidase
MNRPGSALDGPGAESRVFSLTGEMTRTLLANGVEVLTERIPGVRSVSVGVWVRQGSAHELPELMGASHLLEHLVFKGTASRSAREIALALESLGGSLDAYTSREHTSFQARVLDEHMPVALEVLADLVKNPFSGTRTWTWSGRWCWRRSPPSRTPPTTWSSICTERASGAGHPYGNSILGTRETVGAMPGHALRDLHRQPLHRRWNMVVAAAGQLRHDDVVARVEDLFGLIPQGDPVHPLPDLPSLPVGERWVERKTSQAHLVFGSAIPGHSDPRRFPLILLSSALGGGMSSRLFQRIREELALAYAVFTFQSFYSLAGISGVYVGTRPAMAGKAVEAVREELDRVAREGIPEEELEQTKDQVKGQIMLSLESTVARLYRLAGFALHREPFTTLDELLAKVDAVTGEDVARVAARAFPAGGASSPQAGTGCLRSFLADAREGWVGAAGAGSGALPPAGLQSGSSLARQGHAPRRRV